MYNNIKFKTRENKMTPTQEYNKKMNNDISEKLGNSKTYQLMNIFNNNASIYPASVIDAKSPKRDMAISKALDHKDKGISLYDYHTKFKSFVNEYSSSVVLICNDTPVNYMIEEVGGFVNALNDFYKEIKKSNNVQELQLYYKDFKLKPKEVVDAFIYEIGLYAEKYGFKIDKKEISLKLKTIIN
jgi:hypothetical protein